MTYTGGNNRFNLKTYIDHGHEINDFRINLVIGLKGIGGHDFFSIYHTLRIVKKNFTYFLCSATNVLINDFYRRDNMHSRN